jgi:hypothetical protein
MPLFRKAAHGRISGCDFFGVIHTSLVYYQLPDSIIDAVEIVPTRKDTGMAVKSSLSDIDAQIEKLRERRRTLIVKSAERFARAATKSGLAEMEITDEELDAVFEEIAARFRKGEKKGTAGATAQTRRQPGGGPGTPAEVSHDG